MAYGNNNSRPAASSSAQRSSGSAGGFQKKAESAGKKADFVPTPTTHIMKVAEKEGAMIMGTFITENEFGLFLNVKEDIPAGKYYINKKKSAQQAS